MEKTKAQEFVKQCVHDDSTAEFMQTNGVKKVHTCIIFDDGSAAKISYGDGYSKAYAV